MLFREKRTKQCCLKGPKKSFIRNASAYLIYRISMPSREVCENSKAKCRSCNNSFV